MELVACIQDGGNSFVARIDFAVGKRFGMTCFGCTLVVLRNLALSGKIPVVGTVVGCIADYCYSSGCRRNFPDFGIRCGLWKQTLVSRESCPLCLTHSAIFALRHLLVL